MGKTARTTIAFKKQREVNVGAKLTFTFFIQSNNSAHIKCHSDSGCSYFCSVKPLRKHHHKHTQRQISVVILNLVRSTVKCKHDSSV